jgi:hypothetical protein
MKVGRTKKQPRAARAGLVFPEQAWLQVSCNESNRENGPQQHPTIMAGRSKKRGQNT